MVSAALLAADERQKKTAEAEGAFIAINHRHYH